MNIPVAGSDIVANQDIDMKADGDLSVRSTEEMQEIIDQHKKLELITTLKVGNAWMETVERAEESYEAGQHSWNESQKSGNSKVDRLNKAAAQAQAVASAARFGVSAVRSMTTAATGGFYGSLSTTLKTDTSKRKTKKTTAKGSRIISLGGDVGLRGGNELSIEGSQVVGAGDMVLSGKRVSVISGENTEASEYSQESDSVTMEWLNTSGVVDLPTVSKERNRSQTSGVSHTLSRLNAGGKLEIQSTEDTLIKGAQVEGGSVDINTGGELRVESVQNTMNSESSGSSVSVGSTMGYQFTESETERRWVDEQTMIVGRDEVNVKANVLVNKGSVIANAEITRGKGGKVERMVDKGKLRVKAEEARYEDIKNVDYSDSIGAGVMMSGQSGYSPGMPKGGTTTVKFNNGGWKKEGLAVATVGRGELDINKEVIVTNRSEVSGVNRDIEKRREITRDERRGGINVDVTLSNKWITGTGERTGVQEFVSDISTIPGMVYTTEKGLGGHTKEGVMRVMDATGDLADTVGKVLSNDGVNKEVGLHNALGVYNVKTEERQNRIDLRQQNAALVDAVNQAENGDADKLRASAKEYARVNGIKEMNVQLVDGTKLGSDAVGKNGLRKDGEAFYDKKTNTMYLNVGKDGINISDGAALANSMRHEIEHARQNKAGQPYDSRTGRDGRSEMMAYIRGEAAQNAWESENKYEGYAESGTTSGEWLDNQNGDSTQKAIIDHGTVMARGVENPQPIYTYQELKEGGGEIYSSKEIYYKALEKNKNIPATYEEAYAKGWKQYSDEDNALHMWDKEYTVKFVAPDGREGVYNFETKQQTINPKNRATFNQYKGVFHVNDVMMYVFYGTGADDPTTFFERGLATGKAAINKYFPNEN